MTVRVIAGNMLVEVPKLASEGARFDSIVTDPPYHLTSTRASAGFMGKAWDGGDIAFRPETWRLCWELLPPGGHLIAFAGTRTYHRMTCAIEDAGFEIRDMVSWLYGSGFPKSHDVSKGIDKAAGAEREVVDIGPTRSRGMTGGNYIGGDGEPETRTKTAPATDAARRWEGWGTALKPALEPICLARKPLDGTVASNVLKHGTGALNIDGCRVGEEQTTTIRSGHSGDNGIYGSDDRKFERVNPPGRWPANVCHDGSDEVVSAFPNGRSAGNYPSETRGNGNAIYGQREGQQGALYADVGSAARFFYSAKADADDRLGSKHPTVKPVDLMRWLVRLITPPRGHVLDPFAGSGTTGMACMAEGFRCTLIEREAEYVADIQRRLAHVRGEDTPLFAETAMI